MWANSKLIKLDLSQKMDKMIVRFSLQVTCLKGVNCDCLQLTSHIFIMVRLVVRKVKFCSEWLVEWKRNVMAHAQKPDLVFQRNGRVHLYRRGCQFSRLLAAEMCASVVVMLDRPCSDTVQECWLPTPFTSFPFTSPPVLRRVPPDSVSTLPQCTILPCLSVEHRECVRVTSTL